MFTTPYVQSVLASPDGRERVTANSGATVNFGAAVEPALGSMLVVQTIAPIGVTLAIALFIRLGLALSLLRRLPTSSCARPDRSSHQMSYSASQVVIRGVPA